jgi:hypothetical protein
MSAAVYVWVLVPTLTRWVPSASYDPRLDLANELVGWPEIADDVRDTVTAERVPLDEPGDVVVVAPVWMVSAQLRAALPVDIPVGCVGPSCADFALWLAPRAWSRADVVVFVHDNRAPADSAALFPDRAAVATHTHDILRGGRVGRRFTIEVLSRRAAG